MADFDFGGYASRNDLRCADGRTIRKDAFAGNDGQTVPLVWQHQRNDPANILGKAVLENRPDGLYAYCKFNDSERAKQTKLLVEHGDIKNLSILATQLDQVGRDVIGGNVREVSVVVAGANPGAWIDNLQIQHSDGELEDVPDIGVVYTGWNIQTNLQHADEEDDDDDQNESDLTPDEIYNSMTPEQQAFVHAMVASVMSGAIDDDEDDEAEHSDEGGEIMKYNVFEGQDEATTGTYTLTHFDEATILDNARRCGSFQTALQEFSNARADELEHGVTDLEILFPEAKAASAEPELLTRRMEWVSKVWNGFKKSPMSRIKSVYADLTMDEARAKGYIKGHRKVEEQFSLLKRVTQPTTIYKKQKFDRDDLIDITDFNFVAWIQREMRMMLDEELSRAALLGDGREISDEDKINEQCIRPIYNEDEMYAMRFDVKLSPDMDTTEKANTIVDAAIRSRKDYRGSGNPTFFTTTDCLNDLMLAKDKIGKRLFSTQAELQSAMRVSDIVEVPVMEGTARVDSEGKVHTLLGIIVNLSDYTIGADRGGAVTMFDDFDIDYNKQIYLIETRLSGSLNKPYSAIILEAVEDTKPVKLTVSVPAPTEEFYSRKASQFQNNILMGSDFLCGKLYHQDGWTEFSKDVNKQEGFYVCLKAEATESAEIYVKLLGGNGDEKKVEDGYCVFRIADPEKQKIRFTAKKEGSTVAVKTFNISNLTLV